MYKYGSFNKGEYMNTVLSKSSYLHNLKRKDGTYIYYHSLFGNARLMDRNSKKILDFFDGGNTIENLIEELDIQKEELEIVNDILKDFTDSYFLVKEGVNERSILKQHNDDFVEEIIKDFPFEFIGFSVTDKCNFACEYCIAGANVTKNEYSFFGKDNLKLYITKFAEELIDNDKTKMGIGFTGGEPLLYWKEIESIIEKIFEEFSSKLDIKIYINTNASLITNDIASAFCKYNVKPYTSLDGISDWNNKVRVYKGGKNTFDDILKGINILRNHNVSCNSFYLTLTKGNFNFNVKELMEFAKNNEFNSITIEPDLINVLDLDIDKICDKLMECYEMGIQNNIEIEGFWKRPFNNMVDFSHSTNGFCRALDSRSIVINKEGYISPCGYSKLKIAKIGKYKNLVKDERYITFIKNNLRGNIKECKDCRIEGTCKGGCLISREQNQKDNVVFDYRCKIYLIMTDKLLKEAKFE